MDYDKITLFHTNLRNVGLFISISFASLTYAGNKSNKDFSFYLLMNSILFTFISLLLSIELMNLVDDPIFEQRSIMNKLPYLLICINIVLLIIGFNKFKARLFKI